MCLRERKAKKTLYFPTHPLNEAFQKFPSVTRVKVTLAKKNLFKKSVITSVILIANAKCNVLFTFLFHTLIVLIDLILCIYPFS